jgi:hypothetical protein
LFRILTDVLQGCPASGSLFILCLDPMLRAAMGLDSFGKDLEIAACADDIGICVSCLELITPVHDLFSKIAKHANLQLGLPKCVVVPCSGTLTDARRATFKRALELFAPGCQLFGVKDSSKYLGWLLGPRSRAEAWDDAIKKFLDRVEMIAASGVPTSAACRLFAERAAPVLGYLATYSDPPVNITQLESRPSTVSCTSRRMPSP